MNLHTDNISLRRQQNDLINRIWMISSFRIRLIKYFDDIPDKSHFITLFEIGDLFLIFADS
jgi:hypothetical protein